MRPRFVLIRALLGPLLALGLLLLSGDPRPVGTASAQDTTASTTPTVAPTATATLPGSSR